MLITVEAIRQDFELLAGGELLLSQSGHVVIEAIDSAALERRSPRPVWRWFLVNLIAA